jgi:pimeloyl-ACP methyl ester carboxylesterase
VLYAARHPARVDRLVLVNPSPRVVDLEITDADRREVAERRREESWLQAAFAAFERIWAGRATGDDWAAIEPFRHGRWDAATAARVADENGQRDDEAAAGYYAAGGPDAADVRAALADLPARVLVVTGEYDVGLPPRSAAAYASLFGRGEVAVQPRGGHSPWRDDPDWFRRTVSGFLG